MLRRRSQGSDVEFLICSGQEAKNWRREEKSKKKRRRLDDAKTTWLRILSIQLWTFLSFVGELDTHDGSKASVNGVDVYGNSQDFALATGDTIATSYSFGKELGCLSITAANQCLATTAISDISKTEYSINASRFCFTDKAGVRQSPTRL